VTYDTTSVFEAICARVSGLPQAPELHRGAPLSFANGVAAYVTSGGSTVRPKLIGRVDERELRVRVVFSCRVGTDPAAAEATLNGLVDDFARAVGADPSLGGTVSRSALDAALADAPEYALVAGPEFRVYPMVVTAYQRQAYTAA